MSDPPSRLRDLRRKHKLTQRQVAESIGIGQDSVSMHESGKMGVALETYRAYARLYGVTVDYLAGDAIEDRASTAGTSLAAPRAREFGVPMAVARLLSAGCCNPVTDAEIAHLSKHIAEGNSPELDDLEIHLLAYRAERDRTEAAVQRFRDAVKRATGSSVTSSSATASLVPSTKTTGKRPERVR